MATAVICEICNRPLGDIRISEHHLIPKSQKGSDVIPLHDICHAKIHHTFTNKELLNYYHTADRIREHEEMQKFIKWVRRKDPGFYDKNRDTAERKRKR